MVVDRKVEEANENTKQQEGKGMEKALENKLSEVRSILDQRIAKAEDGLSEAERLVVWSLLGHAVKMLVNEFVYHFTPQFGKQILISVGISLAIFILALLIFGWSLTTIVYFVTSILLGLLWSFYWHFILPWKPKEQ